MAVYGICGDTKCRIEVEPKSDTGWVTFAETGKYGGMNFTKPLKYRKMGKLVEWRGAVAMLDSSYATHTFSNVPAELVPAGGVTNKYVVNMSNVDNNLAFTDFEMIIACPTPSVGNILKLTFNTTQAFNTVSTEIDFMYLVD